MTEADIANAILPLVGGGVLGFACGWMIKKVIKIMFKLALIGTAIFTLLVIFMQSRGYITGVNWGKMSSDASATVVNLANQTMNSDGGHTIANAFQGFGILFPLGFIPGLMAGFMRG